MGVAAVGTTGMDVGHVIEAIGGVVGKSMTGRGWAWAWLGMVRLDMDVAGRGCG
jgi:hypothetical protein